VRKGTSPILLSVARIFQSIPPVFLTWIEFFFPKKRSDHYPIIFVIAPPRSGSTLIYQLLNRGTKSLYLSNFWNLLYALPYIGGRYVKSVSKNRSFKSDRGLVPGLSGEAEGMKFWSYWTGQGLEDKKNIISKERVKYIKSVFSTLLSKDIPMISGYLGHSFSVEFLRKNFPGCIFIYLKRDELSNIYSMVQTFKGFEENRKDFIWMSLKPIGWEDKKKEEVTDKVLWQYKSIKQKIESEISDKDTLIVNYEEICKQPRVFLDNVSNFAKDKGINLSLIKENIPSDLKANIIASNKDELSRKINILLNNE
jgi:hypothetical protein